MNDAAREAYVDKVWGVVGEAGVSGEPAVRHAHRATLLALAEAGATPDVAARFVERQVSAAFEQYSVLLETLELVSDSLTLTVDISNGDNDDPVTFGYSLVKQKAGLAILHDEVAQLAPFAGVGQGWDREETARARREAVVERDGFLGEIEAIAARSAASK